VSNLKDMCPKCGSTEKVWMERSPDGRSKCECGFEGKHTEWLQPQRVLDKINTLLAMTDEKKPREFLLTVRFDGTLARLSFNKFVQPNTFAPEEQLHVVEYSAYEKLQSEVKRLKSDIHDEDGWKASCEDLQTKLQAAEGYQAGLIDATQDKRIHDSELKRQLQAAEAAVTIEQMKNETLRADAKVLAEALGMVDAVGMSEPYCNIVREALTPERREKYLK